MQHKIIKASLLGLGLLFSFREETTYLVSGKWLKNQVPYERSRTPAQVLGNAPTCKSDLFTVDELKREARHYESLQSGAVKITGSWQHIDLSTLPVPQARFLKFIGDKYGDVSNPSAHDLSACQDVPCVINTVYGPTAGVEGWAIYIWWLKMGNLISFKNQLNDMDVKIGTYNGAVYPLASYLFDKDELYAFWRMSHYLPTQYRILTNQKEIQRLPRGSIFESDANRPMPVVRSPAVCGVAWSSGYILLRDSCLDFAYQTKDRGEIYHLVPHEMSHIVDNFRSGNPQQYLYSSVVAPWVNEGQWVNQEYLDTSANVMVKKWVHGLPDDKFVSNYALSNPIEHFAETLSYYHFNGIISKARIPSSTYNFVKDSIYEQREYTDEGQLKNLRESLQGDLVPLVFNAAMVCHRDALEIGANPGPMIAASSFSFAVDASTRRCLYQKREELLINAVPDVKLNHVEGCNVLKTPERINAFNREMQTWVTAEFERHIRKALEDERYFEQLTNFYQNLSSGILPIQMMTECYGNANEKDCYGQKVKDYVAENVPDDAPNFERLRLDLETRFLDAYKFELVRAETLKTYQDFVAAQSALIEESAKELWDTCKSAAPSNEARPVAGAFSVGLRWMVSSQYNCLNQGIPESISSVVSEMSLNGERVSNDQEKRILNDMSIAAYLAELQKAYVAARDDEKAALTSSIGTPEEFSVRLTSDLSWVRAFSRDLFGACRAKAVSLVNADLRYNSAAEVEAMIRPGCELAVPSETVKNYIKEHPEFKEDFHIERYLRQVEDRSKARSMFCKGEFPANNYFTKLRARNNRAACFERDWDLTQSFLMSQAEREYKMTLPQALRSRMENEGRRIRKDIKDELLGDIIPGL